MSAHVYKEIAFEDEICDHLHAHGWNYTPGDAQHYDRPRALFPPDLAHVMLTCTGFPLVCTGAALALRVVP